MKSSILLLTIHLILLPLSLTGQEKKSKLADYNWEENRPRYTLTTDEENLPSFVLLNKTVSEYIFENNAFVQYSVDHMILRVNTDEAIVGANKISISMVNTIEVVNIKARAISKDGKRINLDKNNIKEIKEDENSSASKIFAIEGIEKGSEIEYFYVKKTLPSIYGFDVFQFSSPVKEAIFQLLSPEHLTFKFKCYNGYPMVKDSTFDGKNIYTAHLRNIPELKDEPSSNYRKNQIRMEYKLAVNKAKSMKEMYTWNDIAQSQYQELFTYSGKETKAIQKLFGDLKLKTTDFEPEKIKTIENFVKTNFIIQEIYKNDDNSLDKIIHNKFANKSGIIKLYIALFSQAKIENQLVLTSERDHIYFDDTFESWRFLNNYLFYFPGTDKYLSPEEPALRYPIIPHNLTYVNGLFLKIINIGGYESFIPSVKFIPPLDYKSSSHNIDAEIEFIKDMSELKLKLSCTFRGYYGAYTQPYYSLIPDDKKVKALEDMVKDMTKDTKFIKLYAENTDPNINLIEKTIYYLC
ncbi:MAG: DUF3857 domain-containing protein [Bacteroidales bacterium]|nr:DUF3857 domain-containing protein [Bacteroidales bacterium]